MEKNKHLDLEARMQIEEMLKERKNFRQIGKTLGKKMVLTGCCEPRTMSLTDMFMSLFF